MDQSFTRYIADFDVGDRIESIHMPLILDFEYSFKMNTATLHDQNDQDANTFMPPKFIWNSDKWQTYTDQVHLNLEEISDE